MDRRHLSFSALFLQFIFIFQTCLLHQISCYPILSNTREALEIVIGIPGVGTGSPPAPSPESPNCPPLTLPPPPPPPSPPPPSPPFTFKSKRIEIVYSVIQKFKEKITHDPFGITKTWVGPDICRNYKGFFCDTAPDYNVAAVAAVDFNGYNFAGPDLVLAGFIEALPDIALFHANSNNFSGEIPKNIVKLRFLYELDLSNNLFSGEFPREFFSAANLSFLDLRFNLFSGRLPPQVFFLDLDVLFINNNNFMRELPDNLGRTPARYLTLANNKFVGPIPPSIGNASQNLVEVLLLNNQLSGCLPNEIGLLSNVTLFDVGQNTLTGPIPHSFACLGRIEVLNLAQNELYGPVPELVCKLPNLRNLSLSYNYFTSVGPECKKLILRKVVDVRMNCIVDLPGQRSPADCRAFFTRPKCCTDEENKSDSWIPCSEVNHTNQEPPDRAAAAPRSYGALIPHKL